MNPETGATVAAGVTRYVTGQDGQAILPEEGTTNLLTVNQSSVETDTTGFSPNGSGVTLSRDATTAWHGSASLKVITDGASAFQGVQATGMSLTSGQTYTFSVRLKGSGTVYLTFRNGATVKSGGSVITLTDSFVRYTFTYTTDATSSDWRAVVLTPTAQAATFYADALQVEQRAYATSWTTGGTTRSPETFTVPTTGLSPTQGTVSVRVKVDAVARRQVAGQFNRVFQIPRASGADGIYLYHEPTSANWGIVTNNDAGSAKGKTVADSFTPDGWHHFAVRWSSTTADIFIDGVFRGSIANPTLPTGFGTAMYVGSSNGNFYLNALFDFLHVSTVARTDAEIAAEAAATSPTADANTLCLARFNGNLLSDYPAQATIVTPALDLGAPRTRPMHVWRTFTAPAGTAVTLTRVRTSANGTDWGAWGAIVAGMTPWAPQRFIQVEAALSTTDPAQTPVVSDLTVMDWDKVITGVIPGPINLTGKVPGPINLTATIPGPINLTGVVKP